MPAPSTRRLTELLYGNTHAFTQSQRFATGAKTVAQNTNRVVAASRTTKWAAGIKVTGRRVTTAIRSVIWAVGAKVIGRVNYGWQRLATFLVAIRQIPRSVLLFPLDFPLVWYSENLRVWNGLRPVKWATGIKVTGTKLSTTTRTTKWAIGIKVTGSKVYAHSVVVYVYSVLYKVGIVSRGVHLRNAFSRAILLIGQKVLTMIGLKNTGIILQNKQPPTLKGEDSITLKNKEKDINLKGE